MGQVNNADPADPADLPVLVRDMWVRVIHFCLAKMNNADLLDFADLDIISSC